MSAVVTDAGSANGLLIEAMVLLTGPAHVTAPAASPRRVDRDRVAMPELRHTGPHLFDPSSDLMPQGEGRRLVHPIASVARYDREVGVA